MTIRDRGPLRNAGGGTFSSSPTVSPLTVGPRALFWDLRSPEAVAYLDEKVLARLRDDGFAYLKVDYNDTRRDGM